jgi:hypothetical protein
MQLIKTIHNLRKTKESFFNLHTVSLNFDLVKKGLMVKYYIDDIFKYLFNKL